MSTMSITIKDQEISVRQEIISIHDLEYHRDNPRVYSAIEDKLGLADHELQDEIGKVMQHRSSVKNLLPSIEQHGGLVEPIVVIWKTRQVLEGNSRLAAFRILHDKSPSDERWQSIPCHVIDSLSQDQQDSYLSILHQDGKTPWSPYEKTNHIYRRHKEGKSYAEIAEIMGVSRQEVKTRIEVMNLMTSNNDDNHNNYSHYDVLVRSRAIKLEIEDSDSELRAHLFEIIKKKDGEGKPAAQDIRDKLPVIIKNKRQYKKYLKHRDLEQAYLDAKPSSLTDKVQRAKDKISEIGKREIDRLEQSEVNSLLHRINKLERAVKRVKDMIQKRKEQYMIQKRKEQ